MRCEYARSRPGPPIAGGVGRPAASTFRLDGQPLHDQNHSDLFPNRDSAIAIHFVRRRHSTESKRSAVIGVCSEQLIAAVSKTAAGSNNGSSMCRRPKAAASSSPEIVRCCTACLTKPFLPRFVLEILDWTLSPTGDVFRVASLFAASRNAAGLQPSRVTGVLRVCRCAIGRWADG